MLQLQRVAGIKHKSLIDAPRTVCATKGAQIKNLKPLLILLQMGVPAVPAPPQSGSNFVSPKTLLFLRALFLAWTIFDFVASLVRQTQTLGYFRYLTNLSWTGLMVYFALATW